MYFKARPQNVQIHQTKKCLLIVLANVVRFPCTFENWFLVCNFATGVLRRVSHEELGHYTTNHLRYMVHKVASIDIS
jgi:hypothetical protein